ncbi:MAG: hypothetical protein ACYCX8_08985 [Acidimicrobiales bacterium]
MPPELFSNVASPKAGTGTGTGYEAESDTVVGSGGAGSTAARTYCWMIVPMGRTWSNPS